MSTNLYYNRNSLPNSQWSLKRTRSGLSTSSDQGSNVFKNFNRKIRTSKTAFSSATQTNGELTYPKISSTNSKHSTAHCFPTSTAPCGSVQAPILPFLCHNHYGFLSSAVFAKTFQKRPTSIPCNTISYACPTPGPMLNRTSQNTCKLATSARTAPQLRPPHSQPTKKSPATSSGRSRPNRTTSSYWSSKTKRHNSRNTSPSPATTPRQSPKP